MVQPADDRPPPDLLDKNFFIPGRLRYPTPLRPLSPSSGTPTPSPPLSPSAQSTTPPHPLSEATPVTASMLQPVSGAAVTVAPNTVAKQNAGADAELMGRTPDIVTPAARVDMDGRAAAVFVNVVADGEIGGRRRNVPVADEGEGEDQGGGECTPEVAVALPFYGDLGRVSAGVQSAATTIDTPPKPARAPPSPRHGAISNLDGTRDDITPDRDVEAQRGVGGNKVATEPTTPPGFLHSPSLLRLTHILRTTLTLELFLLQIPLTLTIFALWALIPHPPLPHNNNTFGIEFVFLAVGFIGFVLLLVGREAPRFKRGVLGGLEGYRDVLMGKSGGKRKEVFWWDVGAEALVMACFGVVLGLKVGVLGKGGEEGEGGSSCLRELTGGDNVAGWREGGVNCNRLTAVVSLLGLEV